ncbi:MAG TPA: hypothetical protein VLU47_14385 [Blastocatellia bacterium]|nr:hypothetical protein [Blastocatellia bacterium]
METAKVYLSKHDATIRGLREPMPIQIICGDCSARADLAGDIELLPIRTFLGVDDRCYTCGGRSFVIAAELCGVLRRTITQRRKSDPSWKKTGGGFWSERGELSEATAIN